VQQRNEAKQAAARQKDKNRAARDGQEGGCHALLEVPEQAKLTQEGN